MSVSLTSRHLSRTNATMSTGYQCPDCNKVFRRQAVIRRHRDTCHMTSVRDTSHRYRCDVCRRPFTSKQALNAHLNIAHESCTVSRDSSRRVETTDSEMLLVDSSCCIDEEICIGSDSAFAADFDTALEQNNLSTDDQVETQTDVDSKATGGGELPAADISTVARPAEMAASDVIITQSSVSFVRLNNNNNQTVNRNVETTLSTGRYHSSSCTSSSLVRLIDIKPAAITTLCPSAVGSSSSSGNANSLSHESVVSAEASSSALVPSTRLVSVCAASLPSPARQHSVLAHDASEQQKTVKSRLQLQTVADDAATSSAVVANSTSHKIIVYVKTEPNRQQQISYCCTADRTLSVPVNKPAGPLTCQFVCRLCGRDFASEKYLSMHVSSIHRPADTADTTSTSLVHPAVDSRTASSLTVSRSASHNVVLSAVSQSAILTTTQPSSKSHWTCNICQKTFAQNSSYKNHMRTHSDDRPYVCSICSIGFKERYHLKKHELFKHTTALNETCRICGKRFKDSTAVRAHERIHSDVRPYGCTLCGKTFKTSECLWHHENRSKTCGKMAYKNKKLVTAAEATAFVAVTRQRQRRSASNIVASKLPPTPTSSLQHTPSELVQDLKPEVQDLSRKCTKRDKDEGVAVKCEMIVKTEPECQLFGENLNSMLECSDPSSLNLWRTLDDLDTSAHPYPAVAEDLASSSPDDVYSSPDTTDVDSNRSADDICTTTMRSSNVKRYDCSRCDKRFATTATLSKHLQVHAEVRPYRCTVCDIGFKLKVHLKKHNLYRHSEEYPCKCNICGKRFKDSSAVRLHERIHSTARPFQCFHCGKSFKTRENLWGHRNRGPCEQRSVSSLLVTPPPITSTSTGHIVGNNVRLFHSAEFGTVLGVPVSAKMLLDDSQKQASKQPTTNNLCRVTAAANVRVGNAVSSCRPAGLSLVSVPTAVVTPIKRDMLQDRSTSVLATNIVLSTASRDWSTNHGRHVLERKLPAVETSVATPAPVDKYDAVASDAISKFPSIQRLFSGQGDDTILSPNSEQNLTDALSALAGSATDDMVVAGDRLPRDTDWTPSASAECDETLGSHTDDWHELVSTSCDQLLTSTDDDDVALSEAGSLSDYHCFVESPSPAGNVNNIQPDISNLQYDRSELASDTMWCNWAPENDLGSLLVFSP